MTIAPTVWRRWLLANSVHRLATVATCTNCRTVLFRLGPTVLPSYYNANWPSKNLSFLPGCVADRLPQALC